MSRSKGDGLGKTGGRKAGTPNKVTKEKRELLAKFIDDQWDDFVKSYKDIKDPEKKCSIMVSMLPYVFPRLSSIEQKDVTPAKSFQDELDEISGEKTRK